MLNDYSNNILKLIHFLLLKNLDRNTYSILSINHFTNNDIDEMLSMLLDSNNINYKDISYIISLLINSDIYNKYTKLIFESVSYTNITYINMKDIYRNTSIFSNELGNMANIIKFNHNINNINKKRYNETIILYRSKNKFGNFLLPIEICNYIASFNIIDYTYVYMATYTNTYIYNGNILYNIYDDYFLNKNEIIDGYLFYKKIRVYKNSNIYKDAFDFSKKKLENKYKLCMSYKPKQSIIRLDKNMDLSNLDINDQDDEIRFDI